MGSDHHPKTVVVVPVVRIVVVAIRRGGVVLIVIEGTAPQHLPGSLTDRSQQHQYNAKTPKLDSADAENDGGIPPIPPLEALTAFA
jgi:hypothetical protein